MADDLTSYLDQQRARVDAHLREAMKLAGDCPAALREAMEYSLLAPGKRLRPILVLLASEASGGQLEQALDAACAVEMVHTYSLIHDDLPAMDDDDLRRGLPTCHRKFGEALAILAGDALLTLAFGLLAESYPAATAAACCRELAAGAGAAGMVGGQVEDLAWEATADRGPRSPELKDLENIHGRKTGALFRACLRIGFFTVQGERGERADRKVLDALDGFGRCFGQAFQITDDLLDVEGTAEQTGKRVGKDAGRGKLTYPGLLGVPESRKRAQYLAQEALASLQLLGKAGFRLALLVQWMVKRDR